MTAQTTPSIADVRIDSTSLLAKPSQPRSVQPLTLWVSIILFIASGVAQPLLTSQTKYSGLGSPKAQLYMVPYYAGMASVGLLYFCLPSRRWCEYKVWKSCCVAMFGITSQTLNYTGNNFAGSGLFAVIYASVSIWCALLSRLLGLRKASLLQWVTIFVVFGGLVISAIASVKAGQSVAIGAAMLIAGAFLHSVTYVLSEFVTVRGSEQEKLPPHIHCSMMALVNTSIFTVWQFVYTMPHWNETIAEPMDESGTTETQAFMLFCGIFLANFVHSATFYSLLKWIGSVSTAVMKGLQAVLVFVMADVLFCSRGYEEQCPDRYKWMSLIIVISGVLAYALVTAKAPS